MIDWVAHTANLAYGCCAPSVLNRRRECARYYEQDLGEECQHCKDISPLAWTHKTGTQFDLRASFYIITSPRYLTLACNITD
jgi:hypothetical protein